MHNGKKVLVVVGADHKTGETIENDNNYAMLEKKVRELYPQAEILFRWNTEDCIGLDKIAYIGEFSGLMPNVYIGTGFKKWGITTSNVAANIVVDKIMGKENKDEEIFNSKRLKPIKNRWEMKNMLKQTVTSIALEKLQIPDSSIDEIQNDNGGIININGANVGIYKDTSGNVFSVKPVCSHLGCELTWNNLDKTWDCPCHGSRFDYMGKNIYNPANKPLEKINIDDFK
jgi:Rieske Fe-S protein